MWIEYVDCLSDFLFRLNVPQKWSVRSRSQPKCIILIYVNDEGWSKGPSFVIPFDCASDFEGRFPCQQKTLYIILIFDSQPSFTEPDRFDPLLHRGHIRNCSRLHRILVCRGREWFPWTDAHWLRQFLVASERKNHWSQPKDETHHGESHRKWAGKKCPRWIRLGTTLDEHVLDLAAWNDSQHHRDQLHCVSLENKSKYSLASIPTTTLLELLRNSCGICSDVIEITLSITVEIVLFLKPNHDKTPPHKTRATPWENAL